MREITWKLSQKQIFHIKNRDRILVVEGSAGSGKTIFAVHKVILYAMEHPNSYIGVFRSTMPSLRRTSLKEIRKYLIQYNIRYNENKSEGTITLFNGSQMIFSGLDELEKIRSLNLDYEYIEQAEEIDRDTFIELERRVRGEVGAEDYSQILLVVTPEGEDHWIYKMFHERNDLGKVIHFHYTENPFLPKHYLKGYEDLKSIDIELWRKYTEGKWGKLTNIIYENWDNKRLSRGVEYYTAGVDFGYNHPSCFLLVAWYDDDPYIIEEVYKEHLTNRDFIKAIKEALNKLRLRPNQISKVHADSAEPDRIEEFINAGFNCIPVNKGKNLATGQNFIKASVEACRVSNIHIYAECVETLKEIRSYKYAVDKDNVILDIPVKSEKVPDHAMDAMRYCIYGTVGVRSPHRQEEDYEKVYCS